MIVRHSPQSAAHSSAMRAPLTASSSWSATSCPWSSSTVSRMSFSLSWMIWSLVSSSSASGTVVVARLEPVGQRDLMTHAERADEDVDLAPVLGVVEQHALLAVHRVERPRGLIAGVAQQLAGGTAAALGHCEVEVLVLADRAPPAPPVRAACTATPPSSAKVAFCSCASASSRSPSSTRSGRIALKPSPLWSFWSHAQPSEHSVTLPFRELKTLALYSLLLDLYITVLVRGSTAAADRRQPWRAWPRAIATVRGA